MAFIFSKASKVRDLMNHHHRHHLHLHLRSSFVTCTTPKFAPIAATADAIPAHYAANPRAKDLGEWTPIMVLGVAVMAGVSIGVHTAKQQLCHSPAVQVRKKKREMVSEVDNPDSVVSSADKFVNKSFLRKVAHIQDNSRVPDTGLPNAFTRYACYYN